MEWELREIFIAYVDRLKRSARESYQHDFLVWAILAAAGSKIKQPDIPAILRGPKIVIGG